MEQQWQQVTGFQSPCAEYAEKRLSLDKKYFSHPSSMFVMKLMSSYDNFALRKNDHLVIDRSLHPKDGDLVVAIISSEFKVARFHIQGGKKILLPYKVVIDENNEDDFIWGVISSLHRGFLYDRSR